MSRFILTFRADSTEVQKLFSESNTVKKLTFGV
jgi:hypothetical protein